MKIWSFFLVFLPTVILAQPSAGLRGRVATAGQPLEHAVVQLAPSNLVTATNAEGEFGFNHLNAGSYTVSVRLMGFRAQERRVVIKAGETSFVDFALDESHEQLGEVVISGKTESTVIEETSFAVQSIDVDRFKNTTADINQVLNNASGVRIRQSGGMGSGFNFSLNGLADNRVRFFVDDIPIDYLGDAYKLNNLPVNFASRIDIYKGVVPIDLGADALGGAVNVIGTKRQTSYIDASYSYGSFNTHRAALNSQYRNARSGFTIRPKAFYNFSNNDYTMRDMEVYVGQQWQTLDVKRFHDNYMSVSGMLEGGYTYVKWADELMVGYAVSAIRNDVQTDIYGNPRGEVRSKETNTTTTFRYNKSDLFSDRLSLRLFGVFNTTQSFDIDTSSNRYNWLGQVMRVAEDNTAEIMNQKTIFEYDQQMAAYRANLLYRLRDHHRLGFNYIGYQVKRQGENRLGVPENEPFRTPNRLMKDVLGLSYDADVFSERLNINAAVKYYYFDIRTKNAKQERDFTIVIEDQRIRESQLGYYISARYFITPELYVKSSYEKGYRLPEPDEIFGDGLNRYSNPLLKPESSNNYNLGATYTLRVGKSRITPQANFFMRDVSDYMQPVRFRRGSRYENIMGVLVHGFELDLRYDWSDRLVISGNLTQQNVLNNEKYDAVGNPKRIYRERLPNTPYFFWNLSASYAMLKEPGVMGLSMFYSVNYVHEFYLGYKSVATGGEKNTIPTQVANHVGVTVSSPDRRTTVTLEGTNIFNARAFDNFNIQKPGRALYVKLRYNLNSL